MWQLVRLMLVRVLYEDEYLLVAFKPKSVLMCSSARLKFSLLSVILSGRPSGTGLAHRIDYGTCGIVIVYKLGLAGFSLARQFWNHSIVKKYICLSINAPRCGVLGTNCSFVDLSTIIQNKLSICLLDCKLVVGKRHQIRLTQRHICGDRLYCVKTHLFGLWACMINALRHQCLSAYLVCLRHAASSKMLGFETRPEPLFRYLLINFLKLSALGF